MHEWWADDPNECFWLEVTDRNDLGANLQAPEADGAGRENWRYALFKSARVGDVVFHFHKPAEAIVAVSRIAGPWFPKQVLWAAHGTSARSKGTVPHDRPGYAIPLTGFSTLSQPLTLEALRGRKQQLLKLVGEAESQYGTPLYFPFELSARSVRPLQGYAFKLPAAFVLSQIELDVSSPPLLGSTAPVTPAANKGRASGQGFARSSSRQAAVEKRAMEEAYRYFTKMGFDVTDLSMTHPYDLQAEHGDEVLHVEVKGISGGPETIFLTRNEVAIARKHPDRSVLYILHSIKVRGDGINPTASGGRRRLYWPWKIDDGTLEAMQFRYAPPALQTNKKRG